MRELLRVDDPADPRIAEFRAIRDRDLTGRGGRFIAEGTVVLRMLAAAHGRGTFIAEKLLLLENRVAGVGEILTAFPDDVPAHVASQAVIDGIAGFNLHRGVLAIGRRVEEPSAGILLEAAPETALVAVAVGISNHDNIGSIFRNAAAFGVDAVLLDQTCCDPLYRKALRVSVGSVLSVPYARQGTAEDILTALGDKGYSILGLSPAGRQEVGEVVVSNRMALLTGTEGEGLPAAILAGIATARIAQRPGLDSLNAATATGIALYRIAMAQGRL